MKLLHSIKDHMTVRKIIGLILLAACIIFLAVNGATIRQTFNYFNDAVNNQEMPEIIASAVDRNQKTSLLGNQRVEQTFVAQANRISMVDISIHNPERHETTGELKVTILDEQDKEVVSTSLPASLALNDDFTKFSFNGDTQQLNEKGTVSNRHFNRNPQGVKIKKGQTYTLVLESTDVRSASQVAVNGNALNDDKILNVITYFRYHYAALAVFALLILFDLLMILWPEKPVKAEIAQWVFFALNPFANCYIMFKIASIGTVDTLKHFIQLDGWINILLIFTLQWVIFTLINRVGLSAILTTAFMFIFSTANYVLMIARDAPLSFNDIILWKTAAGVAKSYSMTVNKAYIWGTVLTITWICLILAFEEIKGFKAWKLRAIPLVISCFLVGGTVSLFRSDYIGNHMYFSDFSPKSSYRLHGYLLGFTMSVKNSFVHEPKQYTVANVKKITDQYASDQAEEVTEPTETTPNIIVVINEAFTDFSSVGELSVNQDAAPFLHSMKENTIKGTMHSSVYGGHTANTEFEFLTGHTTQFLPQNAVPFKTMIRDKAPCLAWNMQDQGYVGNIAFHPGKRNAYGRDITYPHLGFKEYISVENLKDPEMIRDYVSDKSDYEVVCEQYETYRKDSRKPFFLYNMTIQNHGNYLFSGGIVEGDMQIEDQAQYSEEAAQYLNLVKISDNELKKLVKYFEEVDEPTVLVFFGDHQPRMAQNFLDVLLGKNGGKWSFEDIEKKYEVPFFIWANYDIEEETDVQISANYIRAYLMQKTGGKMTGYDKYLMDLREKYPVLTNIGYYDSQGTLHNYGSEKKYNKDILQYEWLQYNAMFDQKNRVDEFFYLKK